MANTVVTVIQYTFQDALNSHTHLFTQPKHEKKQATYYQKQRVLACTMDRSPTMSSVSHTNSVLSWSPHLMPGKNEIDSCATLEHILPQPQLSSYMSMVHLSTPLQLLHMMECDRWAIEMQSFPTALIKNTYFFWAPPFFFFFANTRKMIIVGKKKAGMLSSSKLFVFFSFSYILFFFYYLTHFFSHLTNTSPCFFFSCCCQVASQRTHERANKAPYLS